MTLVRKLRLCLAVTALLLVGLGAAGAVQVDRLARNLRQLEATTVPALDQVVRLTRHAAALGDLERQVRNAADAAALADLAGLAEATLGELERTLLAGPGGAGAATGALAEDLAGAFAAALEARRRSFELQRQRNASWSTAQDALDAVGAIVEPDATRAMLGIHRAALIDPTAVDVVEAVGEVNLHLTALVQLTNRLRTAPAARIGPIGAEVSDRLETLSAALARHPWRGDRAAIGQRLWDFSEAVTGTSGLLSLAPALMDAHSAERAAMARLGAPVAQMSRGLERALGAAREELLAASGRAAQIVERRLGQFTLLVAAVVVLGGLFLWWLMELALLRPLAVLTENARRIAAGRDALIALPAQRRDEIGALEAALQRARHTADELRRSNEELTKFAYVASHDLRAPLRAVQHLVEWTVEDHGPALPAEARANLDLVRQRTQRLSDLLSSLLDYARAGRGQDRHAGHAVPDRAAQPRLERHEAP
ncbi:histidine kinase dimerization/phospho-acceptor domain-containing protein [Roseivivax sp. CAU 1761]